MENILSIQSLTKSFTRRIINSVGIDEDEQYHVINNLSLNVPKGKIIALIGGNGAGKTTLFNIISGFVKPQLGHIIYAKNGIMIDLIGKSPDWIARNGIGRLFQDNHIFPDMSVLDNMLIAGNPHAGEIPFYSLFRFGTNRNSENNRKHAAQNIFIELFGVNNQFWEERDKPAGQLSFGQQRLLGLARLLMQDSKLFLLDEPTAGVNPEVIIQIKFLIQSLVQNSESTILLIEHNLGVVQDIADFCCFMSQGRIDLIGTPEDIIANDEVQKSYLGIDHA